MAQKKIRMNNTDEQLKKRIDNCFKELENYIQKLPLSDKGKNYIWFHSFIQFYDTLIEAEDGSCTYGIETEWQLQKFKIQFNINIQKTRIKVFEQFSKKLDELPKMEAVTKIDKELHRIKHKELFAEIGGEKIKDWDKWLQKFLINEKEFHTNKKIIPMANKDFDFEKDSQQADKIEDLQERILFLKKRLKEFNQQEIVGGWEFAIERKKNYAEKMIEEIKFWTDTIKLQPQQTKTAPIKNTPVKPIEPIKWKGTVGQLIYLFEQLQSKDFFSLSMELQAEIRKHFVDEDGKPFTSLKQSKQSYLNTKTSKPKRAKEIEDITDKIKEVK